MSLSRSPSTPSEGEIVEDSISDFEKATTSLPSVNGASVNRSTRPQYSATPLSRSRSPATAYSTRSPRRDRSRSPYRERRGEKRRRDDDFYYDRTKSDSRRYGHKGYESRYYDDNREPYVDLDRHDSTISSLKYDDDSRRYRDKRLRTRSRSPYRRGRRDDRDRKISRSPLRHFQNREHERGDRDGKPASEQLVSELGRPSGVAHKSMHEAETRGNQVRQGVDEAGMRNQANKPISTDQVDAGSSEVDSKPVDEATLIEERRKRREAIKAKYRGPATPLLVQALQLGNKTGSSTSSNTAVASENQGQDSAQRSQPQTPDESEPSSPIVTEEAPTLGQEEDLLKLPPSTSHSSQIDEEGPSAADYDPTLDMQEDRMKQDRRQHNGEVPASAYDETQPQRREIPVPGSSDIEMNTPKADVAEVPGKPKKVKKKPAAEFDMFAEEDEEEYESESEEPNEEDMGSKHKLKIAEQGIQLDASMLDNWDDPEGYYRIILGELLDGRYNIQSNLGKGVFSSVVRAKDAKKNGEPVAIKIVRANDTMKKAGQKEIAILRQLADADPDDKKHVIRFHRSFEHKGHLCMVFENLSLNLREVVKRFGRDVGINIRAVRTYATQMFLAASLLRKCSLLHADLKPDNILVNEAHSSLKVCDLGSAAAYNPGVPQAADEITPYLVSRYYRAPEIILGMTPDPAIDMWSIGCTLYELYTGKILFPGRSNNQMLKHMMECRGKFPVKMLKRSPFSQLYFDELGNFQSIEKDKLTGRDVSKTLNINKPVKDLKMRLGSGTGSDGRRMNEAQVREIGLFRDLLEKCLELNPEKRITPSEALKHPFVMRAKN